MTIAKGSYVKVAVALPVFKTFTYEVPEPLCSSVMVGKRVLVPFKNLQLTGYILAIRDTADVADVKKILDILDDVPLFPPSMVPFFRWIADYYLYPIGQVIKGALPGGLNVRQVVTVDITEKGRSALSAACLKPFDCHLLKVLEKRGAMGMRMLSRMVKKEILPETMFRMERRGWITRQRKLAPGRVRPKMERYVTAVEGRPPSGSLSKVRQKILDIVEGYGEISVRALKAEIPTAASLVRKMAAEGFLNIVEREVYRDPFGEAIERDSGPPTLTEDQASVVETLVSALGRGFQTYLLYGITASGKTEVYMQAVAAAISQGKQALVLVPEIALISQTERIFRARFGDRIALLHSGLSEGERFDQ
ncbi:MAG: hypothetical protein DRH10_06555 [Deltaproteobacteria bacterium]|nr:MAG: hypothetical protein DRH10_06555 [Deltaproteobacteria bacterium]